MSLRADERLMVALIVCELRDLRRELVEVGLKTSDEIVDFPAALANRLVERLDYLSKKLESL